MTSSVHARTDTKAGQQRCSRTAGTGRMTLLAALHAFALIPSFTQKSREGLLFYDRHCFSFSSTSLSSRPSAVTIVSFLGSRKLQSPLAFSVTAYATLTTSPATTERHWLPRGCLAYLGSYFWTGFRFTSRKGSFCFPFPSLLFSEHAVFQSTR